MNTVFCIFCVLAAVTLGVALTFMSGTGDL
jgi:hypothetical protein